MGSIPVRVTNIIGTFDGAYFVYFASFLSSFFTYMNNIFLIHSANMTKFSLFF